MLRRCGSGFSSVVDPDSEPDPYLIRIQELCGSGSVPIQNTDPDSLM